jgi:maltose alpha-D-glucosyltransferase/alpha-amylase
MPEWLSRAIFYQVYPQSFYDANGDGIGDLNGLIEKLDYICSLGCNAVWLNPCFESPFRDAGYDISDYRKVASRYGTNEDMKRLIEEMHRRNMHLLLDLVPGHTSMDHPWFQRSMQGTENEYTDRYVWTDSVWKAPAGMSCIRGISARDGSCAVNFFSHQPALNYGFWQPDPKEPWQQPMDAEGPRKTLAAMIDVMRFWLDMGCDGFRVDMAGSLVKNDPEGKGTISLWQQVRKILDQEYPQAALISEWGEPDRSLTAGFHMDFLLQFGPSHYNDLFRCGEPFFSSRGKGDASEFIAKYRENERRTGGKGLMCIPSGNHDMDRLARRLHGNELKLAFAFLLSMPGAPFIYYGDEIGMHYLEHLVSVEGGYNRTGSRSPMQWSSGRNRGFSTADSNQLYLRTDDSDDAPDAENQEADPDSLLNEVRALTALRKAHPALQNEAGIEFLTVGKGQYPLAYIRSCGTERILAVINPSAREQSFSCDALPKKKCLSIHGDLTVQDHTITIAPAAAAFYLL